MGLLDDAIREHLDLKRRRGADPGEIERLEREALGPVRRGPHEAFEAPSADAPGDGAAYSEDEPVESWSEPREQPLVADHASELIGPETAEDWVAPERGPVQGGVPVEPDIPSPATPAPPAPAEPAPRERAPASAPIEETDYLEQETVEHDVEREELGASEEDDMLEETPEFLQDTPDHDRLWFEQRPPRDFDLDG